MSTGVRKSGRQKGVTIHEPPTQLPGSGRAKRARGAKKKQETPAAVPAAALVTPVRALDPAFTMENEYMTRVLGKCSASEIKDIGQCLVEAHRLAVAAGVTGLTMPAGGFESLVDLRTGFTIKLLCDLQAIGKWKCGTPKPDLPVGYPDDPTMDQAKNALITGLNQLEFKALKAKKVKPPMTVRILQELRIGSEQGSLVCREVLTELGKESLVWQSDTGSVMPWRLEFYLRSVGVDVPTVVRVIASFGATKNAPKTPATVKLMTEVVHALIKDVKEMEEAAKRLAEQLRKDAAAAQALADAKKIADAEKTAAAADGSDAASFMSGMTKEQTESRMTYSVKC